MTNYTYDIFLSYSGLDEKLANQFASQFQKKGQRIYYVPKDRQAGDFIEQLEEALKNSASLVLLASLNAISTYWVLKEIRAFLVLMREDSRKSLIPVILPGLIETDIPPFLRSLQYVDCRRENLSNPNVVYAKADEVMALLSRKTGKPKTPPDQKLVLDFSVSIVNEKVREIKELIAGHRYSEAVEKAEKYLNEIELLETEDETLNLRICELRVRYAHALMYIGKIQMANNTLNEVLGGLAARPSNNSDQFVTWCLVCGLAHNHLGYINWMELLHFELAIKHFVIAIEMFRDGRFPNELATSLDNMGRVCSQVGYFTISEALIDRGRKIREVLTDKYRLALSLDSMANVYLTTGQYNRALLFAERGHQLFQEHYRDMKGDVGRRGIGLSLITIARAKRSLCSHAYTQGIHKPDLFKNQFSELQQSEEILRNAETIFLELQERIRLYQIYREWAILHHERARLFHELRENDEALRYAEDADGRFKTSYQVIEYNRESANLHQAIKIDVLIERAFNWCVVGERERAKRLIEQADQIIPGEYKITKGRPLDDLSSIEAVEEYWRLAGKIHLVKAALTPNEQWSAAIEEYILAMIYIGFYQIRIGNNLSDYLMSELQNNLIYEDIIFDLNAFFHRRSTDEIIQIQETILPNLVNEYHANDTWLPAIKQAIIIRKFDFRIDN